MKKYLLHLSACAFAVALAACGGGNDAAEDKASAAPAITTQPVATSAIVNYASTFKVVATGGGLSYKWYKLRSPTTEEPTPTPKTASDTPIAGVTAAEFTFNTTLEGDAGDYYVVVSNILNGAASSVTSNTAKLTVNLPPSITTQPVAQTVTAGSPATFSVVAKGSGTLIYQWYSYPLTNGTASTTATAITGATSASYTIDNAQKATHATTYFVTILSEYGSGSSTAVKLTVN